MHHPTTRRSVIRTGLLSLTGLFALHLRGVPGVMAEKNTGKKKTSVASRANGFIDQCFDLGGEPTVDAVKPGGTTVTCAVAGGGSQTCTFTKKSTRCHENAEGPPLGTTPDWTAEIPDVDIQPAGERKRRRR